MKFYYLLYSLVAVLFLAGCSSKESSQPTEPTASLPWVSYKLSGLSVDSTQFSWPVTTGEVELSEASGLAASQRNPGYLWVQEDSGNDSEIHLIRPDGTAVARFELPNLENRDWEDIAVGPGPVAGQSYVYVAEIGDNAKRYDTKIIYRFPEPSIAGKSLPFEGVISETEAIRLRVPNGPKDSEAILVDPLTRDIYLFSKEKKSLLYRAAYPQSVTKTIKMERLLAIPIERVTAASVTRQGDEILLRDYFHLYYYKRQSGESVADALKRRPVRIPLAPEYQGEAVAWALDGSGYYTTTEKHFWDPQPIYFYRREIRK